VSDSPVLRLPKAPSSVAAGLLLSLAAVAVCTLLIFPLREIAPPVSTGVVYLLGVLVVSIYSGRGPGLVTSVLSAIAFNFFHIPPTGHIEIADGENWVALAVFLISAVIVSSIADQARARADEAEARRREADLAAQLAEALLGGRNVPDSLEATAARVAEAFDLSWARIELGEATDPEARALHLSHAGQRVAVLLVPSDTPDEALERLERRVVPSLEALLGVAIDREELVAAAVEARALRRSDEIKTALLRSVSHDLRSPITAVMAAGEALESRSIENDDRLALAGAVSAEARRLSDLVDKLLDLSRLEAGQAEPRTDWCSIEEVVAAAVEDLGEQAGLVRVSLDRDLPYVRADAAQLERAIANLLENAVRFSAGQTSMVRGRAVGERLVLRIVDRGPGIPEPEIDQVFEPFYRVDGGGNHPGSGLGLSIVRGFIEVNGGRVWAESVAGQGTTFVIELPLEPEAEPDPAGAAGAREG
jgi:two-component system sensor histidine kinase KdpD